MKRFEARSDRSGRILRSMTSSPRSPTPPVASRPGGEPAGVVVAAASWSRRAIAGMLLAAAVLAVVLPAAVAASLTLIVAVLGLLAGVPHGAVDHLVLSRLAGRPLPLVTAAYAAIAGASWALLHWVGPLTVGVVVVLSVVVLSVVHFGLGELEVYRAATGWHPGSVIGVALAVAGTGALLLPLARSGAGLAAVASAMSPDLGAVIGAGPVRLGIAAVWGVAAGVAGVAALRAGRASVALDVVLVGALGAFLPPLAAFAVWFGGWHAVRHTGRLLADEPGCAALIAADRTPAALRRFARLAAPPSLAALAVLLLLLARTTAAPDLERAIAEVLQVLLALTVPHMVVVLWLDRRVAR
jgi:beta-carotene 15,15'-dioxygenase